MKTTIEILSEASRRNSLSAPFEAAVKKIAKQTDENDHGGAILTAAKLLKNKSIADRVTLVMKLHRIEGHMPMELMQYRRGLYDELMRDAKSSMSTEKFDELHGAF